MCPEYQTGLYSITILNNDGMNIVHDFGTTEFKQHIHDERELITNLLRTGLNVSEMYTVTVTVESDGFSYFRRKFICELS